MRNVFPSEPIKERERNLSSNHKKKQIKKNHSMEILLQECVLSSIHASKLKNMLLYDKAKRRSVMSVTYETND